MSTMFVYLRPKKVAYCRAHGAYAISSVEAWAELFEWLEREGLRNPAGRGFGLMRDDPRIVPPSRCRYDGCIELPPGAEHNLPRQIGIQTLPGGAYARERHVGLSGLSDTITRLRDEWAPANGLAVDPKRPFMEIFYDDPMVVPAEERMIDVCVPVIVATASNDRSAA
jgi:AraC family transcriptional regulator